MTGYEKRIQRQMKNSFTMRMAKIIRPPKNKPTPRPSNKTRRELHCHNCGRYVQFEIDLGLDGCHLFNCPNCSHEHYRVVRDGVITAERWGKDPSQFQGMVYSATVYSSTTSSTSMGNWTTYGNTGFTTDANMSDLYTDGTTA